MKYHRVQHEYKRIDRTGDFAPGGRQGTGSRFPASEP